MNIVKINFVMTYVLGVAQDQFEVGLNQEEQSIFQDLSEMVNLIYFYLSYF